MSNTYAIASAKGGVGKTTTVANLGAALAAAGTDTVVVDADVGMANLARTLGVTPDGATLHDVLAGTAALEDALYDAGGLTLLPGSEALADYRGADLSGLDGVLSTLAAEYDHVIVDTGAGLSHDTALPLEAVDEVVLVSTPQPQALGDTEKTRELVERLGGRVAGLVVTRATDEATVARVDADVIARIPDDPAVDESVLTGEPVVSFASASPAAEAYRRLAGDLFAVEVPVPEPDAAGGDETADESEDATEESEDATEESEDTAEASEDAADDHDAAVESEPDAAEADSTADAEPANAESVAAADDGVSADDAESTASEEPGDDESSTATAERPEDGAPSSDASPDSNDQSTDEGSADEAEPKSVGPHRTEDVPVSEAEPDADARSAEAIAGELDDGDPEDADSTSSSGSKGFLSRLLGR